MRKGFSNHGSTLSPRSETLRSHTRPPKVTPVVSDGRLYHEESGVSRVLTRLLQQREQLLAQTSPS